MPSSHEASLDRMIYFVVIAVMIPEEHVVVVAQDVGERGSVLHGLVGRDRGVGGGDARRELVHRDGALDGPDKPHDNRGH